MHLLNTLWFAASMAVLATASGCGGGGSATTAAPTPAASPAPNVPINYLAKYQGVWIQACAEQIQYGTNTWGPSSSRIKYVVSAPDASGKIQIDSIEEFFETGLVCGDFSATPKVALRPSVSATASFTRTETLPSTIGPKNYDVLNVVQPQSTLIASGSGFSYNTVGGISKISITFSDGKIIEGDAVVQSSSGELGIVATPVNTPDNLELRISGDSLHTYKKQ